jgi:hypothetical protein
MVDVNVARLRAKMAGLSGDVPGQFRARHRIRIHRNGLAAYAVRAYANLFSHSKITVSTQYPPGRCFGRPYSTMTVTRG